MSLRILLLMGFALALGGCGGPEPSPERVPIGTVRGRVRSGERAGGHRSPWNGRRVVLRGVVHQLLSWKGREGRTLWGLLLQDLPGEEDGDPETSDGIFVYCGLTPTLRLEVRGDHPVRVGDRLEVRGQVNERYGQTELAEARILRVLPPLGEEGLPAPLPLRLSDDPQVAAVALERVEGMRVGLEPGVATVSGTHPEERNGDLRVWVVPPGHPVLGRRDPRARLLYRGGMPLSGLAGEARGHGHGRKILLGSLGLRQRRMDPRARLPPLAAGAVFPSRLVGGIQYSYGKYVLQIESFSPPDPAPPVPSGLLPLPADGSRLRVATYNLKNLYDFHDDPFDLCDFEGDPGCRGTRFPLNYVPPSDERYRARLRIFAEQIVGDMGGPDLLMLQEVEDQDVAWLEAGGLVYGERDNADGELDSLQDLVVNIVARGGPVYGIASDRAAADDRGIVTAFLYRTDRFRPLDARSGPALLRASPGLSTAREWFASTHVERNPKAFNARYEGAPDEEAEVEGIFSRAVQVMALEDVRGDGQRVWLLNNHFSAGPGRRIERRTQQAALVAELASAILAQDPQALLLAGGDLNAFPRPDDPVFPPSDQLAPLYSSGLVNAVEPLFARDPANARSYLHDGEANLLDHLFLSPEAFARLRQVRYLPLNSTQPEAFADEPPLRPSDHDPLLVDLDRGPRPPSRPPRGIGSLFD